MYYSCNMNNTIHIHITLLTSGMFTDAICANLTRYANGEPFKGLVSTCDVQELLECYER